ncbi:hypothetical protein [Streptomyces edwardsiae]|uniref:Uncharacterized protein n=1 Tax=Streptomyces edwardsiae TaxID=3075527 RepID=A0ABU2Q9N9_9ACTN|nr:hypothetical protein [Streptomyces sp. DSM 41635]MDT0401124.1 hypothetical protein [Streptomyces sp. DSM 41635]
MEQGHPLVRDVFPDLVAELTTLLEDEGEHELAICVRDVRLVAACDCGDDFCQSIHTAVHPKGEPYGEGHRCVPLSPSEGMLILDVVYARIMYVEILNRAPMYSPKP